MMNPAFETRMQIAGATGNIADWFEDRLAQIGADVVRDYETDLSDAKEWRDQAEKAVKLAAQTKGDQKDTPWPNAANVKYPLLTVAALQFNARAYPAIVKGDEAVSVKVVGKDRGRPLIGPDGQPVAQMGPNGPEPVWQVPPGAKKRRAQRVKDFMNTHIFYRMKGWEEDTDVLLTMLPIVGCMFRKVTIRNGRCCVRLVSSLKLIAPMWAVDCKTSPRLTEIIDNQARYQVERKMATGEYRYVAFPVENDVQRPRELLEQHRFMDLDDDGQAEPYVVTVDRETSEVLRLEANFSREEAMQEPDEPIEKQSVYYVKYDFLPNPKGEFYGYGFGHLLDEIGEVVNSLINQMLDAGTAQIAGGGFVASGLRLQGKNSGALKWRPGEYKTVDVPGAVLKDGLVERTFPNVSPVTFQLLDMLMAAAKDISSVKDVITGDASNNGQVGTTLALIEQGLAQFTAVYKRVYRSLKEEFTMLFKCLSKWGGDKAREDYLNILDDMEADFDKDFNSEDFDIRPVSDPTSVTKQQKIARAQFLMGFIGQGLDDNEIRRRALEAADIEDIDDLFPKQPPGPDPVMAAELEKTQAETADKMESAKGKSIDNMVKALQAGINMGEMNVSDDGGIPDMEGQPGNAMGDQGAGAGFPEEQGQLDQGVMGGQEPGPYAPM